MDEFMESDQDVAVAAHDNIDEGDPGYRHPPSRTRSGMSEEEQRQRRESIKEIMADHSLSAVEKRRSIQSLMDGRRRSSTTGCSRSSASSVSEGGQHDYATSMAAAAAAAAEFYDSSDDDILMSDDEDENDGDAIQNRNNHNDLQNDTSSLNPCDAVFVSSRRASSTSGDSSVSQISLGCGAFNRRLSAASSSGHHSQSNNSSSGQNSATDNNSNSNSHNFENNHDNQVLNTGHRDQELLQNVGNNDEDDVKQRFRRYGRARSLQDFGDGAFAAAAAAAAAFVKNDPRAINKRMEKSRPQCEHYERNCTVVSPCCGLAFGCRICHDECPVLPPPLSAKKQKQLYEKDDDSFSSSSSENDIDPHKRAAVEAEQNAACAAAVAAMSVIDQASKKTKNERRRSMPIDLEEEETHHEIDRFAIREVICRKCFTRQSSKTNNCSNCNTKFGEYHCDICNLWMSDKESPYHCHDCGFCRVGGRENFRHCDDCGMCIDALLFDDHNCKVGKYMSNCPVCQEDLFSSRYASHEMPCGHAIHWHCFKELTSYDTRCPVCKKTAETADQMAATWSAMAMGIALQPVPADLARVVTILCYDCEERDDNRRWHFLGVRCTNCLSFNTTVERTTMMGRDAAAFLDELDAQRELREQQEQQQLLSSVAGRQQQEQRPGDDNRMQQREVEMQIQDMNRMHDGGRNDVLDDDDHVMDEAG